MRLKELLLFSLLTILVAPAFAQYEGGNNDGGSMTSFCVSTLDGTGLFSASLTGSSTFCDFSSESYSVSLTNPPQDLSYTWSLPAGATILSGNNTGNIVVAFGNTPGTVSVTLATPCGTSTYNLPVTNGVCTMYRGASNDGFGQSPSCVTNLDGAAQITIAPSIVGSANFCNGSFEAYSIQVTNAPQNVYYNWTGPAGSVVVQGQGSSVATIQFSGTSGDVTVDVITDCGITTRTFAVSPMNCPFYAGGNNDGFAREPICSTTLNGTPTYNVVGITGSLTFCEFGTESYTAIVNNAPANTYYYWTVPGGATIISGQGTATILIVFGSTGGNIGVTITTDCSVVTPSAYTVAPTPCAMYVGGNNDGFTSILQCATKLDGTAALVPGPISGSASFCNFATESYSISPQGTNIETTYVWSVPAGATIISGQGTTSILVSFTTNGGNVSVDISNQCTTVNVSKSISSTSCIFYAGGNNDGHSVVQQCASNLNGGSAFIPGPIVGVTNACNFSTETYSITVAGALPTTTYNWTLPAGSSIISGQGTNSILVSFGNTSGNVAVAIGNECETINVSQPVTVGNCVFYAGGNNDGFSAAQQCSSNLNGGSTFVPGSIVGATSACNFSTEAYSISVAGALPTTVYNWTVPVGASIVSGQGTNSILVSFGNTNGNVAVAISNDCETINVTLAVTVGNCVFYAGGNNDGFSQTRTCATNLNGGSQFTAGSIAGTSAFCTFSTEQYSIAVTGATPTTTYAWSVPGGASIVSGQGTATILVSFGSANGNVAVTVANECESILVTLPVTGSSCVFYAGGNNDGFAVTTVKNTPLPISLVSFNASVTNGVVDLTWETSSEQDNDFFVIERSQDGKTFETLTKIEGAGTSKQALKYQARDIYPFKGTSFYRLSQTDFDGAISYYKVLSVKIDGFAEITRLYPNPVDREAQLHVDFFAEEDGPVKISIVDPAGLSNESEMINVKAGVNLFEFTPHFRSSGVHVIIIRTKDKAEALRLVVL
ncbi:MAG TPA: hypothetical protein VFE50_07900 [Cyclobacteriaceae bacterium]|nr:hypothetical protein [Cyclobacteriaceae bacterium]